MEDTKPIINKKVVLVGLAAFLVLFGVGTFVLLYQGPSQEIPDSSEPQLNFAAAGSKIAGIQVLVNGGGLTHQQYKQVYTALNKQLPDMEPEARYFVYVEESLISVASGRGEIAYETIDTTSEETNDDEEIFEEETPSDRVEMDLTDTLEFKMQSESGAEYKVSVYTAGGVSEAEVTIEKQ